MVCDTAAMFRSSRKFIAVLMLLWLPLSTGSALAASLSMLMPLAPCHGASATQATSHEAMNADMGMHGMHHGESPSSSGDHNSCGVCHLACNGYLATPLAEFAAPQLDNRQFTPLLISFTSETTVPLLPPPLTLL
jgi:Protein of unknown function (DUF2946)